MQTLTLTDEEAHLLYRAALEGLKGSAPVGSDEATKHTLINKLTDLAAIMIYGTVVVAAKAAGGR